MNATKPHGPEFRIAMSLCDDVCGMLVDGPAKTLWAHIRDVRLGRVDVDVDVISRMARAAAISGRGPYASNRDPARKIITESATDAVRRTAQILYDREHSASWLLGQVETCAAKALAVSAQDHVHDRIGMFLVEIGEVDRGDEGATSWGGGWYGGFCPTGCLAALQTACERLSSIRADVCIFVTNYPFAAWPELSAALDRPVQSPTISNRQDDFLRARDQLREDARFFIDFFSGPGRRLESMAYDMAWDRVIEKTRRLLESSVDVQDSVAT